MTSSHCRENFRTRYTEWLVSDGAATRSIPALLDSFCRFLTASGYAVHRCNLATDTIHPQMSGTRHVWFCEATDPGPINPDVLVARRQYRMGDALIDEIFFNSSSEDSPQYRASPFYQVRLHGELYDTVRPEGEEQPYPLFNDLLAQGCTAYYGKRLNSYAGMLQKIGMATRRPGGLTPDMIRDLGWTLTLLTLHLNTLIEDAIKSTLSEVYLGRDPGRRVSGGMIEVGNVVGIEGAIWFSDLRGFTQASESASPEELIETLNAYFAEVVGPIYARGGEVLKYIGDAILAVFPRSAFADAATACRAALESVADAGRGLDRLNHERANAGDAALHHGVALHYGPALYGNIGSAQRLDFTLIGREVNLASRIEGLTKQLGRTLLVSEAFALQCGCPAEEIGRFRLKGIAEEVAVCAPAGNG